MQRFRREDNPYTFQFSYIPPQYIERAGIINGIISNYVREVPTYRGIFITGVRGSGKTVMMSDIRKQIGARREWITIDLNPESNLLESLVHNLYRDSQTKSLFLNTKLDLSAFGMGISVEKASLSFNDEEDALRLMLQVLKKKKKKLLVTIDEITYSKDVAKFSHALSSCASLGLDLYVLMTGLKENIDNIKNKKSLTFLYRAKVYPLETLNEFAISRDYQSTLDIDIDLAKLLAEKTKGYSLAFQAIGYHAWNIKCQSKVKETTINLDILDRELDDSLSEMAYDKIWDELSEKDKRILVATVELCIMSGKEKIRVEDIRKKVKMTSDSFTTYRKRLIDAGVINGDTYGYFAFSLPRFEEYIKKTEEFRTESIQAKPEIQLIIDYVELPEDKQKRLLAYMEKLKNIKH